MIEGPYLQGAVDFHYGTSANDWKGQVKHFAVKVSMAALGIHAASLICSMKGSYGP
jgi:hypothetical protein